MEIVTQGFGSGNAVVLQGYGSAGVNSTILSITPIVNNAQGNQDYLRAGKSIFSGAIAPAAVKISQPINLPHLTRGCLLDISSLMLGVHNGGGIVLSVKLSTDAGVTYSQNYEIVLLSGVLVVKRIQVDFIQPGINTIMFKAENSNGTFNCTTFNMNVSMYN